MFHDRRLRFWHSRAFSRWYLFSNNLDPAFLATCVDASDAALSSVSSLSVDDTVASPTASLIPSPTATLVSPTGLAASKTKFLLAKYPAAITDFYGSRTPRPSAGTVVSLVCWRAEEGLLLRRIRPTSLPSMPSRRRSRRSTPRLSSSPLMPELPLPTSPPMTPFCCTVFSLDPSLCLGLSRFAFYHACHPLSFVLVFSVSLSVCACRHGPKMVNSTHSKLAPFNKMVL